MPALTRTYAPVEPQQLPGASTWVAAAGASFEETWATGPVGSLEIGKDIRFAEDFVPSERLAQQFDFSPETEEIVFGTAGTRQLSRRLSPDEAKQQVEDAGLTAHVPLKEYPNGLRQDTLDLLIDLNKKKVRRQTIASQYDGWSPQVAGMLAGSIVDPLNIALAFVPVVGEARYAKLLASAGGMLGRTGVRLGVGAAEGVVGAALVEPIIYQGQQQWRNDYDAYDSMLNIAGGAAFGALLHAGVGLPLEALTAMTRKARVLEPELRPEAVESRALDAGPRALEAEQFNADQALSGRPFTGADAGRVIDDRIAELERLSTDGADVDVKALEAEGEELRLLLADQEKIAAGGVIPANPRARLAAEEFGTVQARRVEITQAVQKAKGATAYGNELARLRKKLGNIDSDSDLIALGAKLAGIDEYSSVRPVVAVMDQKTQAAALRMAVAQAAQGQPIDVTPAMLSDPIFANVPEAAAESMRRATANTTPAPLPKTEPEARALESSDEIMAMVDELEADFLARGGSHDDLDIADDLAHVAQTEKAAKAIALCMMRTA